MISKQDSLYQAHKRKKEEEKNSKTNADDQQPETSEPKTNNSSAATNSNNQPIIIESSSSDDEISSNKELKPVPFGFLANNTSSSDPIPTTSSKRKKRKTSSSPNSPNTIPHPTTLLHQIVKQEDEELILPIANLQQHNNKDDHLSKAPSSPSPPSSFNISESTMMVDEDYHALSPSLMNKMQGSLKIVDNYINNNTLTESIRSEPNSSDNQEVVGSILEDSKSSTNSDDISDSSSKKSATTATNSSTTTVNESKCVRLNIHVHIPHQYIDGNTPIIKYQYKPVTTSIRNKKEELKTDNVELSNNGESDIWNGSILVPLNVDVITCKVVICNDERAVLQSEKELRSITLPKHTSPTSYHVYINFRPKLEKRQGIFDSLLKNKISMTEAFLMHIFTPSKINTDGLLSSDDVDNAFENLVIISKRRMLNFWAKLDGFLQSILHLSDPQSKSIHLKVNHTPTNRFQFKTDDVYKETKKFMVSLPQRIHEDKTDFEFNIMTTLVLFEKVYLMSANMDRQSLDEMVDLLKELDVYTINTIFNHVLKKDGEKVLGIAVRDSFRNSIQYLLTVFSSSYKEKKKFSFWILSSPFINFEVKFHGSTSLLETLILQSDKKRFEPEFATLISMVEEKRALIESRHSIVSETDLSVIFSTLFKMSCTLNDINCILTLTSDLKSKDGRFRSFGNSMADFMLKFDWQDGDFETFSFIIEKHPQILSKISLISNYFKNKSLLEVDHYHVEEILDHLVQFVENEDFKSNVQERELIAISKVLAEFFSKFFGTKKSTYHLFGKKSVYNLKDVIGFYSKMTESLTLTCLGDYQTIITESIANNVYFKSTSSDTYSKILSLIEICSENSISGDLTLGKTLAQLALDYVKSLGSGIKVLSNLLQLIEKYYSEQSEQSLDIVSSKIITYIAEMLTEGPYLTMEILLRGEPRWCRLFKLSNLVSNSRLKEATGIVDKFSSSIKNQTISLQMLRLVLRDDNQEKFMNLTNFAGVTVISKNTLVDIQKDVEYFEKILRQCHDFSNFMCQHDSVNNDLRLILEKVEADIQNNQPFYAINASLNNFAFLKELPTLQHLCKSELFLKMWNETIDQVVKMRQDGSTERVLLYMKDLKSNVYPTVVNQWLQLYNNLNLKTILFADLETLFNEKTQEECNQEMLFLKRTCQSQDNMLDGDATEFFLVNESNDSFIQWAREHSELIWNFLQVVKQKEYIPMVVSVLKRFNDNFLVPVLQDPYFNKISTIHNFILDRWESGNLFDVVDLVHEAKTALQHLGRSELFLIEFLNESDDLLQWLWQHSNTSQFNELIRVCREVTDDAIVLQSFASLTSCREYLYELIYPNQKFLNCESFLKSIRTSNQNKDEKEIQRRITDCKVIRANLENVKQVFKEKTRSPSVTAVLKLVEIVTGGTIAISTEDCFSGKEDYERMIFYQIRGKQVKQYLSDLIDIRTTVLNTTIPNELKEKHANLDLAIDGFCKIVNVLSSIKRTLIELGLGGSMIVDSYQYAVELNEYDMELNILQFLEEERRLIDLNSTWKATIKGIREDHRLLNYFNTREVRQIIKWLELIKEGYDIYQEKVYTMLKIINKDLTFENYLSFQQEWIDYDIMVDDDVQLITLGTCLFSHFNMMKEDFNHDIIEFLPKSDLTLSTMHVEKEKKKQNLIVIACQPDQEVEAVVYSLYAVQKRLPRVEEVLMCRSSTEFEDIQLLVRRWSQSRKPKQIFTIANIHHLDYTLQCKVVDMLKGFLQSMSNDDLNANLAIISGNQQQRIVNAFSNFRFDGSPLSSDDMRDSLCQIALPGTFSSGITVYTSKMAGCGKSHSIFEHAYKNFYQIAFISLRESVDVSELIQHLNEKTSKNSRVLLHFNIAPNVDPIVNSLLFELIVVGSIRDHKSNVYHRRAVDAIAIEIPNQVGNTTLLRLVPFCKYLPRIECAVSAKTLSLDKSYSIGTNEMVVETNYRKLKYVCSVLIANERQIFRGADFETFDPMGFEVSKEECMNVLTRHCNAGGQISFAIINNFVEFTYEFFENMMGYEMLRFLPAIDTGFASLPQSIIGMILEMSKDFAVRQLVFNYNNDNPSLEEYSNRFSNIRKWEDSSHPIIIFVKENQSGYLETSGFNVISLDQSSVNRFFPEQLRHLLHEQRIDINFDFKKMVEDRGQRAAELQGLKFLRMISGNFVFDNEMAQIMQYELENKLNATDYVLTQDNLMKMIAIICRFKSNLPVILHGESGGGKTYLISHLCNFLDYTMHRITLHGGNTESDIFNFLNEIIVLANIHPMATYVAFIDECNTCSAMAIVKEVVCDGILNGIKIPNNVKIVAALNPYRLKSEKAKQLEQSIQSQTGIIYKHPSLANIPDPLENLVYRVHPLPDSFIDHLYDFGSLSAPVERLYVKSMLIQSLKKYLKTDENGQFTTDMERIAVEFFENLIFASQVFIRETMFEESAVSLRDVRRCIQVFSWLAEEHHNPNSVFRDILKFNYNMGEKFFSVSNDNFINFVILSLSFAFYSRLNREERHQYVEYLSKHSVKIQPKHFGTLLAKYQLELTQQMNVGEGIALNEALTENIFILFLALVNHIPLLIQGYPGTCKSLAVDLVSKSMRGKASNNKNLQHLPDINIFAYQCSPLSEAKGIAQTFKSARQYAKESRGSSSLSVVLLDEIGLAADSPKLPLKILHQELENTQEISVVSISNYSLDSSKMNRMCVLYRSTPSAKDLKDTAKGIMRFQKSYQFQSFLEPIALSYLDLYKNQRIKQFFGLRDFYNLVKFLYRIINNKMFYHEALVSIEHALFLSILRNFGGIPSEDSLEMLRIFETKTGIKFSEMGKLSSCDLLKLNLLDSADARHLLVLTNNNSALNLLFDYEILTLSSTLVLFGSDFPDEKNDNFSLSLQLQKIKLAMSEGNTVVLVHCESLYESLYDLLNQHYVVVENKKFSRLAFGNSSVTCPVHDRFRIIIIAEASDAYSKLAIPFLNRMEKHVIKRDDMMSEDNRHLYSQLCSFIDKLMESLNERELSKVFIGYHRETLKSLVQSIEPKDTMVDEEITDQMDIAFDKLVWNMTPEAVIKSKDEKIMKHYFEKQEHSSLPGFMNNVFRNTQNWQDKSGGIQLVVTTFSSLLNEVESLIRDNVQVVRDDQVHLKFLELHDMKTSSDLNTELDHFFNSNHKESMLVLLCDPTAASTRRIHYAQYTCESKRNNFNELGTGQIKHVIFVVNLSRTPTESARYSFDFDRRWNYVFIDDISNSEQEAYPELFQLVNTPFSSLLTSTISVEQIILGNLHNSLSRVVYPFPRTGTQIQTQLSCLKKWLTAQDQNTSRFVKLIKERVLEIVRESVKNDEHWYLHVVNNEQNILQICGTLRSAIRYFISKVIFMGFSSVLSVLDRYNNLQLLNQSNFDTQCLWLDILELDVHNKLFESSMISMNQSGYVNILHGSSKHFDAKFPFSFIFTPVSNAFRVNNLSEEFSKEELEKHFEFSLPRFSKYYTGADDDCIIDDMVDDDNEKRIIPNILIDGYIDDYHILFGTKNCNILAEKDQLELIHEMLSKDLATMNSYSILDAQISYWNNEKRLRIYYQILDSLSDKNVSDKFLSNSKSCKTTIEMDMLLCELVIIYYNPETYITWWGERIHETSLWIRKVQNMSASMTQLLDLLEVPLMASKVEIDQSERSSALSHKWKCIKFFSHFLKDLANSSQDLFDADISKKYWEKLNASETNHFLQQNALVDFLQTLTDINKKCSREDSSEDFECFICISVPEPENLRTTVCCKRYICYDCADEFCSYHKKSKSCGWCQKDLDNDESVDTYTIPCSNNLKEVEEISQKENSFIEKATKLIETFITKFCIERGVSESLIRDITSYICENKKFLSEHKLLKFILSDSMKSSIVRSLFSIKNIEPEQFEHVIANLEENLKALYNQSKNIDFPIAVCISQVLEDEVEFNSQDEEGNIAMEKMDSTMLKKISKHDFTLDLKNNFVDFLTNGSIAKVTIKYFVKLILKEVQFGPIFSELLTKSVNTLFTSSNNLVLYFLRILSSKVGLSETRDILNFNSVVNGMSFIKTWKNSEEVVSFLKDSVLTSSNPFFNLPLYNEITRALAEIRMSNGDTDEQFKQMYATAQRQNSIHNLLGQLITVVLEEITLSNKVSPKNFDGLRLWCASNREMFSCYGISIFDLLISLITNKVPKFENINPETLMSEIQQLRCIVNLILMVFINPVCNGFFSKCLLAPQQIVNNLFPTMNDDILAGLGTITNGRVYQCPSGHVYVITECGRAATVSNCPECGQQIGGTNHNLLGTNKEYDVNGENSPTNLCYRVASEENGPADIYLTQRTLSAIEVRFIRLVMSGLLFASGSFFKTRSSSILNTRYANPRDVNTFFFEHFSNDWNIFSRLLSKNEEQTSAVVNSLLTRMRSTNIILQNSILTKTVRDTFERTVCENILGNVLKNDRILNEVNLIIQNHQNSIEHRKQNKNEKLAHSIELVNILPKDVPVLQPSLYMGLENITFEHFSNTFKQSHEEYPILETIITEIVSLQALKYLPHIFKMYIEVCKKCDKKLRKEQPLEQTIRQFIDEIQDPNERTSFSSYFEGFSKAWNLVFKYVEMYECLVIPQQMKNIKMSLDQQLAFILPHEKDESIFGIALTHYLVGIHNKFVKLVSKAHVTSEADIRIVSSSDLDTSLVFKFSSKRDLMPFVRDHCRRPLSYASTESIKYDFEFIQQHLSDHFFIGKPLVEIKIKMIEFIGELRASGAKERFSKLKKSNKHVADKFNDEEKETILIELGGVNGRSDRCVKVFRLVEMAIHFIQSSSVSVSALSNTILDKLLVEYLEKDLSVNEARPLFGSSLSKMIRIKHLDSLWELLESHLTVDSFAAVHTNYRKEISDKHKDLLKSIAPKIDLNILLTTLREAIQTHLTESFSDMNQDLKKWLYYLPIPDNFVQGTGEYANSELETISDFSWFNIIPDDTFTLGMVVEIFKTLEQIAKQ